MHSSNTLLRRWWFGAAGGALCLALAAGPVAAQHVTAGPAKFSSAVAFDSSKAMRDIAPLSSAGRYALPESGLLDMRPDHTPVAKDTGFSGDAALRAARASAKKGAVFANFEGLSNLDNFNVVGFRVNPPDPVGDVGPRHYVEMVNLAVAVFDKQGSRVAGPIAIGDLWAGFPIEDCADPSGDPIVVYDEHVNRWILSQFTTRGLPFYYNCVAVSKTPDPTGDYYRYAFVTQADTTGGAEDFYYFPDYPKYGVWTDSYIMTTRDFGDAGGYGISVYALEKAKMISGNPNARAVQFFLDSEVVPVSLIGDGLLPADLDGKRRPQAGAPAPIIGSQDDDFLGYGAAFDALNIWELTVLWNSQPVAELKFAAQLPVAEFDSVFPCGPSRGCLPQPGIANPDQWLDVLSYRQRVTHRLAYRNFGGHESMVTNQSVEAKPGIAGVRWYEVRRTNGVYSVHQQGTYSPDSVNRWMGSAAMDRDGNIAIGYSVVDGVSVYPGIRYAGRLAGDTLGEMTLAEQVIINGTGVQTTTNSRWGDYTSLNVDPTDDCTFWYVNEYYEISGLPLPLPPPPLPAPGTTAPWQTRIASFKLPGCSPAAK
jgi:hypothetical protein